MAMISECKAKAMR